MALKALSGISNTLDISYIIEQAMPKFTEKSGIAFAKKGHIEHLKFAERKLIKTSAKHRPLIDGHCISMVQNMKKTFENILYIILTVNKLVLLTTY